MQLNSSLHQYLDVAMYDSPSIYHADINWNLNYIVQEDQPNSAFYKVLKSAAWSLLCVLPWVSRFQSLSRDSSDLLDGPELCVKYCKPPWSLPKWNTLIFVHGHFQCHTTIILTSYRVVVQDNVDNTHRPSTTFRPSVERWETLLVTTRLFAIVFSIPHSYTEQIISVGRRAESPAIHSLTFETKGHDCLLK